MTETFHIICVSNQSEFFLPAEGNTEKYMEETEVHQISRYYTQEIKEL